MVVTLGALDLLAEEEPGRDRGQRHRAELHVGERVVDRAVLLVRALGGDQVVDHLVPGAIVGELPAQPGRRAPPVDLPLLPLRPISRTVHWLAKFLAKSGWFSRYSTSFCRLPDSFEPRKRLGLLQCRDAAEDVEIDPAEELLVGRRLRRLDLRFIVARP